MSTWCRTIQMLEPDTDTLVGTTGERDQSLEEDGSINLVTGQESAVVVFQTPKFSSDYEFLVYVANTTDPAPTVMQWIPLVVTITGFTLGLAPSPDTNNYVLYWRVRVRDEAILTPPTLDGADGAVTPLIQGAINQVIQLSNPRSTNDYNFSQWVVENLVDGDSQQSEWVQISARTTTSFTVVINPPTNTPNYSLRWSIPG